MRPIRATRFSQLASLVSRKSHQLTSRYELPANRRLARLESIGVRALSRHGALAPDIPPQISKLYDEAYKALRSSGRRWATDAEIKSIIFGDKEMSHERSAEIIEILRSSGIQGFHETDEMTPGTVYSERMLGVLRARNREKSQEQRAKRITSLSERDRSMVSTPDIDAGRPLHDEPPDRLSIQPLQLMNIEIEDVQPNVSKTVPVTRQEPIRSERPKHADDEHGPSPAQTLNEKLNDGTEEVPLVSTTDDPDL